MADVKASLLAKSAAVIFSRCENSHVPAWNSP